MRKWKEGATVAEKRGTNLQNVGLRSIFQNMSGQKKAQQHVQSKDDEDKITSGSILLSKKEDPVIVWTGLHY